VHQRPGRTGHQSGIVGRGQDVVALLGHVFRQDQRLQPIVAVAAGWLLHQSHLLKPGKGGAIAFIQPALGGKKARQLFQLRAAERGVEVGDADIVADLIVNGVPAMRAFGGSA